MDTLTTLKARALKSTRYRGHRIHWTPPYHSERTSVQNGVCTRCGMEVQINVNPLPNGIDIGGEAVALNCNKEGV